MLSLFLVYVQLDEAITRKRKYTPILVCKFFNAESAEGPSSIVVED